MLGKLGFWIKPLLKRNTFVMLVLGWLMFHKLLIMRKAVSSGFNFWKGRSGSAGSVYWSTKAAVHKPVSLLCGKNHAKLGNLQPFVWLQPADSDPRIRHSMDFTQFFLLLFIVVSSTVRNEAPGTTLPSKSPKNYFGQWQVKRNRVVWLLEVESHDRLCCEERASKSCTTQWHWSGFFKMPF